jgi:serine/threonine-protein kinase RsbW
MIQSEGPRLPRVRVLAAHPDALVEARTFVRELAVDARLPERTIDELTLAVSEACSNAVAHTDTLLVLVSWQAGNNEIEVQVKDDGVFERRIPITQLGDEGGLGIPLMMSLVDEFAIRQGTPESPGTQVKLRKSRRSPEPSEAMGDVVRIPEYEPSPSRRPA